MINNLFYFILLFLSLSFSLILAIILVPMFIKIISKTNFFGKDMNKFNKPNIPELGGLPVFLSFIISILLVLLIYYLLIIIFDLEFYAIDFISFSLIIITLLLIFVVGFIDDILGWKKGISQIQHFIYPIFFFIV